MPSTIQWSTGCSSRVERPEVVSAHKALIVSGFANLYSCFVYWAYFSGLLFLIIVADDFRDTIRSAEIRLSPANFQDFFEVGQRLMRVIFLCVISGILSATSIKLNAAYLISDGENNSQVVTDGYIGCRGR